MFSLRNLFHVSFLAKLITVVWLLYASSPHPKHFALHIAYTCQHSYFPVKVQLTLQDCLKPTLMCFIKWNLGCWGRSPGRLCLTSETSVKSSWSWNKQIGGLSCSCKLGFAHSSKRTLQGVWHQETPHTGKLTSLWILSCRVGGPCPAQFYTQLMTGKSYCCLCEGNKAEKWYTYSHLWVCFTFSLAGTVRLSRVTGTHSRKTRSLGFSNGNSGLRPIALHRTLLVKSASAPYVARLTRKRVF